MGLPAGQQRVLDGIAETLRRTEPRLTVMFAIFTWLTKNEPTPCREQLTVPRRATWLPALWQQLLGWRSQLRGLAWRRLLIISPVAIGVIALVVLACVSSHGAAGCGDLRRPHADAISVAGQPGCVAPGSSGVGWRSGSHHGK
ncbi:MAG TPA: hypothetical protein VKB62_14175 [Streptosporangiaceae bacterium]|nr:hypothetical protein [Streptosporangiaceae bacterium]